LALQTDKADRNLTLWPWQGPFWPSSEHNGLLAHFPSESHLPKTGLSLGFWP